MSIDLSPYSTTTYFVRAEKNTNFSDCISYTINVRDTYNETENIVYSFLDALNDANFTRAFYMQNIPRLGTLQEFSSTERYGGINTIKIFKIKEISNDGINSRVKASYEAYDPFNKDQNISQVFYLTKSNNKWVITELETVNNNDRGRRHRSPKIWT